MAPELPNVDAKFPLPTPTTKPVVVDMLSYGKEKQYKIILCKVPGGSWALVQAHKDWFDQISIDPKTNELTLPGEAGFNLQPAPDGYILMNFKGVISLWEKK